MVDLALSPELRFRASSARPTTLNGATRIRAGNSSAEGSVQYDPATGRELGRLIVQGTARTGEVRKRTQEDLFSQILGGRGADFFPVIDPSSGLNVSNDFRTLSPDQILSLHKAGFTPLGGSPLFTGSSIFGGTEQSGFGTQAAGASAESAGTSRLPMLAIVGAALLLVVLLVKRRK